MSTCISRHGEYSSHALAGEGNAVERFVCTRCFAIAEDDLFTAFDRLEAELAEARATSTPTSTSRDGRTARSSQTAASAEPESD